MVLFLLSGLLVVLNVVRSGAPKQRLFSEMKNLLIWQDQFASNEEKPPLVLIADDHFFMRFGVLSPPGRGFH